MQGAPCYPPASSSSATDSPPTTPRPVSRARPTRRCPRPGAPRRELLRRALPRLRRERVLTSDLRRASETAAHARLSRTRAATRACARSTSATWAGRPLTEFPAGTEPAWRGGPLARARRRDAGPTCWRASAAPSTSCSPRGTWLDRLPRRRRARRALARHRRRPAPRRGPGERQRDGDPSRRLAWRPTAGPPGQCPDRAISQRKFRAGAALEPVRRSHPGAFAGRRQMGTGRPAQWGRRAGRLPPSLSGRGRARRLPAARSAPTG